MKLSRLSVFLALPLMLCGCNSFERNTFNTLATSKGVIDQAQADYVAKTIPRTTCTYAVINDAKAAQTLAVNSMLVYEAEKSAGKDLAAQEATVALELADVVPLIAEIKVLYTNPSACMGGK